MKRKIMSGKIREITRKRPKILTCNTNNTTETCESTSKSDIISNNHSSKFPSSRGRSVSEIKELKIMKVEYELGQKVISLNGEILILNADLAGFFK